MGGAGGVGGAGPDAPPEDEPPPEDPPAGACADAGPTTLYLSADDSNSQASPVLVRALIEAGRLVPPEVVRTYEFLNQASFRFEAPAEGLAIRPELRPAEEPGQYRLVLGVRSPDMARAEARPLNVVLLLDSSGSMAGPPMEALRAGVTALLDELTPQDRVSVVRMSAAPAVLADGLRADQIDRDALFAALVPNGATDLEAGLRLAYARAFDHAHPGRMSRVVLFSDGGANAGQTSKALIAEHAGDARAEGMYLMGVGLGEGFDDSLMDAVTDLGKGAYVFVDGPAEAERVFHEQFVQVMELAALDVQVALTLPARWQLVAFHGEEVSTNPAEVTPQNLAPADQMVISQVIGTCAPDAVTGEEVFTARIAWTDARTGERRSAEQQLTLAELLAAPAENLDKVTALVAFAEGLQDLWALREGALPRTVDAACAALDAALTLDDPDVRAARALAAAYCPTVRDGEQHRGACDCGGLPDFAQALGVCDGAEARSQARPGVDYGPLASLGESTATHAREGCRMAALTTGALHETETVPGAETGCGFDDPAPAFTGNRRGQRDGANICDLKQVSVTLTAPADAQSFSFDFWFFSAEFPEFIGSEFNDTFYAILEAPSTHGGVPTNISFDAAGRQIEINNDYFASPYHPCGEAGTGFARGGSTCWLRTSWPIEPGETFTLTFSIHDEGDAVYSSTVLLDNLRFHPYPAVGMTDPLN
ncbi:MAG: VWA domain-containing protein [Myxococcales bacterium]|nr:VWA domain-containing protein [Myxococcales bacterium]